MMNFNKMTVLSLYTISIIFPLSSPSWVMIWVGLEMNLLMFIFMTCMDKSSFSNESTMKYFLIQSVGSMILLFSLSVKFTYFEEWTSYLMLMTPLALMLKSGLAPLHSWMPEILNKMPLNSILLMLTFQKITPLVICFSSWTQLIIFSSLINIVMGSLGGLTESSFVKILVFSSINNSGWMIFSFMSSFCLFIYYFIIYCFITISIITIFMKMKIKWLVQLKSISLYFKLNLFLLMFSLSGLPPLLGFLPKWIVINSLMPNLSILAMISILFSGFTLFFYLKSCIFFMMNFFSSSKWNFFTQTKKNSVFLFFVNLMGLVTMVILT